MQNKLESKYLNEHMLSVQCSHSPVHSYRSACYKLQTSWASLGQLVASLGQSVATHWPLATSRVCISKPEQSLSQPWWRCNSTPDRHKLPPVTSHIPGDIHKISTLDNNHSMLQVFIKALDFGVLGGLTFAGWTGLCILIPQVCLKAHNWVGWWAFHVFTSWHVLHAMLYWPYCYYVIYYVIYHKNFWDAKLM